MVRHDEEALLSPCRRWLNSFLKNLHPRTPVTVLEKTESSFLGNSLGRADLARFFPQSSAWEVKVDVVAVLGFKKEPRLVFVELKVDPIRLRDVGQLLGYCRVCKPMKAFILSPAGLSADLQRLLTTYGRTDVLRFDGEYIQVGLWDCARNEPDWSNLIPGGVFATCRV